MPEPLVTIIIPTYNRSHLIGETIQSVIQQTYSNWELVIVDDGSDDESESIVRKFSNEKIFYHKIEHCGLLGKVRNHGIQKAKGDYIAFLDSDDLWRPDKLSFQLSLLSQYPQAGFIFSNGNHFGPGSQQSPEYQNLFVGNIFEPLLFRGKFCVYMPSLMFKKTILEKVDLMNETWKGGGDIDFFYRICHSFTGIFTNERLVSIRKHAQSTSQKLGELSYFELLEMYSQFFSAGWITKKQLESLQSHLYYKMGLEHFRNGNSKVAIRNFSKYNALVPFHWKGWVRLIQASIASVKA